MKSRFARLAAVLTVAAASLFIGTPADAGCAWGVGNAIYTNSYLSGTLGTKTQARLIRIANGRSRYYYGSWGSSSSSVSSTYGSAASSPNHFRTEGPTGNRSGWKLADGRCR